MIEKQFDGEKYGTFPQWEFGSKIEAESFINTMKVQDERFMVKAKVKQHDGKHRVWIRTERR